MTIVRIQHSWLWSDKQGQESWTDHKDQWHQNEDWQPHTKSWSRWRDAVIRVSVADKVNNSISVNQASKCPQNQACEQQEHKRSDEVRRYVHNRTSSRSLPLLYKLRIVFRNSFLSSSLHLPVAGVPATLCRRGWSIFGSELEDANTCLPQTFEHSQTHILHDPDMHSGCIHWCDNEPSFADKLDQVCYAGSPSNWRNHTWRPDVRR